MSESDAKKSSKEDKKGPRDNLRTSMQQKAYTQLINKEQSIVMNKTRNDVARLEPLFTVNNNVLGMFKKDDYNNDKIKIGHSLNDVDLAKVDPSKAKPKRSVVLVHAAPFAFREAGVRRRHQEQERLSVQQREIPEPAFGERSLQGADEI